MLSKKQVAAAIAITFAGSAASAQEFYDDSYQGSSSTIHASVQCVEEALRNVFGEQAGIDTDMEHGLITAGTSVDGNHVLAEIYLGFEEAIASINVTAMDSTATIFYQGSEGSLEFYPQGQRKDPLEEYINSLDRKIRDCAGANAFAAAIS